MLLNLLRPMLFLLTIIATSGCDASVRRGTLHYVSGNQAPQERAADSGKLESIPVEYVWNGDPQVLGASLYPSSDGLLLKGRLRAQSFTMFRPSRVVRVEAVDAARCLLWSGTGKMKRDHGTVRRRSRTGTFSVDLPSIRELDHMHVGAVAKRNAADMLSGTCLQDNSFGDEQGGSLCR